MTLKKYKLVPVWRQIEGMTHLKDFVPLWQDLLNNSFDFKTDFESLLYKKITYFLLYGPAGLFFLINNSLGKEKLNMFIKFITDYINDSSTPGHYYPSPEIKRAVTAIRGIANTFNFEDTLNEISKILESSHGIDNPEGWHYHDE